jgi:hypothetical protein
MNQTITSIDVSYNGYVYCYKNETNLNLTNCEFKSWSNGDPVTCFFVEPLVYIAFIGSLCLVIDILNCYLDKWRCKNYKASKNTYILASIELVLLVLVAYLMFHFNCEPLCNDVINKKIASFNSAWAIYVAPIVDTVYVILNILVLIYCYHKFGEKNNGDYNEPLINVL